jgi:hypothetical protein
MQYHQMLKQKHETEEKQAAEAAKKRKEIEFKVNAAKNKVVLSAEDIAKAKEDAAEEAAKELLRMEERNDSKKSFKGDGMKKGFLNSAGKKK